MPRLGTRTTRDQGGQNFLRSDLLHDMLAYPAQINRFDVLHSKFGVMLGEEISPILK